MRMRERKFDLSLFSCYNFSIERMMKMNYEDRKKVIDEAYVLSEHYYFDKCTDIIMNTMLKDVCTFRDQYTGVDFDDMYVVADAIMDIGLGLKMAFGANYVEHGDSFLLMEDMETAWDIKTTLQDSFDAYEDYADYVERMERKGHLKKKKGGDK